MICLLDSLKMATLILPPVQFTEIRSIIRFLIKENSRLPTLKLIICSAYNNEDLV